MYPSDYGYAAGNTCVTGTNLYNYDGGCYQKDWLNNTSKNEWLLSPNSGDYCSAFALYSSSSGFVNDNGNFVNSTLYVRPVFYLSSSVSISSGDGSSTNPYILS